MESPLLAMLFRWRQTKASTLAHSGLFLRAEQVAEALQAMSELDEAQLRLRYDFPVMLKEEVYPLEAGIVSDEDEEEFFAYMLQHFNEIRRFYSQTAAEGKGLIFYIFWFQSFESSQAANKIIT